MMAFWLKCQNILGFCPLSYMSENANDIIFQHVNLAHVGLLFRLPQVRSQSLAEHLLVLHQHPVKDLVKYYYGNMMEKVTN